jgi:hypothetical protein
MRHEDYPCCGCGPEGCVDLNRVVKCQYCGTQYHPDPQTEKYCYSCQYQNTVDSLVRNSYGLFCEGCGKTFKNEDELNEGCCPECECEEISETEPIGQEEAMEMLDRWQEEHEY